MCPRTVKNDAAAISSLETEHYVIFFFPDWPVYRIVQLTHWRGGGCIVYNLVAI